MTDGSMPTLEVGFVISTGGSNAKLANRSTPDAEALIRLVMTESAGHALDAAVLSIADATEIRPAGLLNRRAHAHIMEKATKGNLDGR